MTRYVLRDAYIDDKIISFPGFTTDLVRDAKPDILNRVQFNKEE